MLFQVHYLFSTIQCYELYFSPILDLYLVIIFQENIFWSTNTPFFY